MNWNFAGQAHVDGQIRQCTYNPETPDVSPVYCGNAMWDVVGERRIYAAKQALFHLIDLIEPQDAMQIIGFSSSDYAMHPSERQFGTLQGKATLREAVLEAGSRGDGPYVVGGGTPTARALLRAREVLASLPEQAPNGESYRRRIILLTDGVPNHFDRKYDVPWGNNVWRNTAKDAPACASDPNVGENVSCQTGYVG